MKYCEICAGANDDGALECKYCHTKFSLVSDASSSVVLRKGSENNFETNFESNSNKYNQYDDSTQNSMPISDSYTNSLSTGLLIFWCIVFGLVPSFGMVMTSIVWAKEGNRNLFIMRLVTCICMFVPSVLLLLLLCLLSFI